MEDHCIIEPTICDNTTLKIINFLNNVSTILNDSSLIDNITQFPTPTSTFERQQNQHHLSSLISDEVVQYIYTINLSILTGVVSIFGIGTNTLNMFVFARMKFSDTMNIALFVLSLTDFMSLVCLLGISVMYCPLFVSSISPDVLVMEIQLKTITWARVIITRVSTVITMYITLERCLCIALPLKIKRILTPRRVTGIMISIYIIVVGTLIPIYTDFKLGWKFMADRNRTVFGVVYTRDRLSTIKLINMFSSFYTIVPFIVVTICSMVLVWKLTSRKKWLSESTRSIDSNSESIKKPSKENQVIKMILSVAIVFIACFIPSVGMYFSTSLVPELLPGRRYENTFTVILSISVLMEGVNASVNIFVYYNMSSKYKSVFDSVFTCLNTRTDKK